MRRLLLAVVAVAVAATVAWWTVARHDRPDTTARDAVAETTLVAAPVVGPTSDEHGVPAGWSHDTAGARAAAVSAVGLTGDVARAGPITRADMITALASAQFAATLTALSAGQLADVVADLAADGTPAGSVLWSEWPLTAKVTDGDAVSASVQVWSVTVTGAPGSAARQAWRTVTVGLVWERDDWRVDTWSTAPGPTPMLAVDADVVTVDDLDAATWPAAATAVTVGGG